MPDMNRLDCDAFGGAGLGADFVGRLADGYGPAEILRVRGPGTPCVIEDRVERGYDGGGDVDSRLRMPDIASRLVLRHLYRVPGLLSA